MKSAPDLFRVRFLYVQNNISCYGTKWKSVTRSNHMYIPYIQNHIAIFYKIILDKAHRSVYNVNKSNVNQTQYLTKNNCIPGDE